MNNFIISLQRDARWSAIGCRLRRVQRPVGLRLASKCEATGRWMEKIFQAGGVGVVWKAGMVGLSGWYTGGCEKQFITRLFPAFGF